MKKKYSLLPGFAFLLAMMFHAAVPAAALKVVASPAVALFGEPFSWKIEGLKPGEGVTLKAASRDAKGMLWRSAASFTADAAGTVDVGGQAPDSGSYSGADIFGLLWSMKPEGANEGKPVGYRVHANAGWTVDLLAENAAGETAAARFRCVYQRPGDALVRIPLDRDGLSGFFYCPAQGGPFPGVLILGGSEGGLSETLARAMAANGFAALTLAYFNYPNLPDELVEIPLEYVDRAIAWLKARPQVRPGGVGLFGGSKGGELALLVASRNSGVRAVAALTPAAHAWEGHSMRFFSPDYRPISSWSLGNKPLPYVRFFASSEDKEKEQKGELDSFVPFFREGLARADAATVEAATIPVERIQGGILLVSGTEDRIWPAGEFCALIMERLKKLGFAHEVRHVSIENGGHNAVVPSLITANRGLLIDGDPSGGSPRADAQGGYRAWAETIAFLRRHL